MITKRLILSFIGLMILYSFAFLIESRNANIHSYQERLELKQAIIDELKGETARIDSLYQTVLYNMDNIGNVDVTVYQPVAAQTNSRYWETADQSIINLENPKKHRWVAVSRDLHYRYGGPLKFGDLVWVKGIDEHSGLYRVRDLMNKRFTKRIDILVGLDDEVYKYDNPNVQLYKLPNKAKKWLTEAKSYNNKNNSL